MIKKDLIVLVADKDMEHALKGLLARPAALGIRSVTRTFWFIHNMTLPVLSAGFRSWPVSRTGMSMVCSCSIMREAEKKIFLLWICKSRSMRNFCDQRGERGPEPLFCRRNLSHGSGAIPPTLTTWQGGKIEILRFVAGWPIRAGYKRTRPNPGSPKRLSGQPCVRHKRPEARPCMSRLRTRFPCMDAATRRFMNSKAPCNVGFPKVDGMSADDGQYRTCLTTKRGHRHAGRARDNGQPRV